MSWQHLLLPLQVSGTKLLSLFLVLRVYNLLRLSPPKQLKIDGRKLLHRWGLQLVCKLQELE